MRRIMKKFFSMVLVMSIVISSIAATVFAGSEDITITSQPQNVTVVEGEKATIQVKAEGTGLTYQWYYKMAGKKEFTEWAGKTTYKTTLTTSAKNNGMEVYCKISDSLENTVDSEIATITVNKASAPAELKIVTEPKDVTVNVGEKAAFSVEAEGDGLTYQWYYKLAGKASFTEWAGKTSNKVSLTTAAKNDGMEVYCKVTDANNQTVNSKNAKITFPKEVSFEITKQPENATVNEGEKAYFTIEATGEGLTYQWFYKTAGKSTFTEWAGKTTNKVSLTTAAKNDGMAVYCKVTDANGEYLDSDIAVIAFPKVVPFEITKQPESVTVKAGEKATFSIEAVGEGLTYQWFYKTAGKSTFTEWAGKTSNKVSLTTAAKNDGMEVYCTVTDANERVLNSYFATIRIESEIVPTEPTAPTAPTASSESDVSESSVGEITPPPTAPTDTTAPSSPSETTVDDFAIIEQPSDVNINLGEKVNLSVQATGTGLTYQWYYKSAGKTDFVTWIGKTSNKVSYTPGEKNNGMQYYCEITNAEGRVLNTDTVTLRFNTPEPAIKITKQPESVTMDFNGEGLFYVEAEGEDLYYEWYFNDLLIDVNSNNFSFNAYFLEYYFDMKFMFNEGLIDLPVYVVVTNNLDSVKSDTVTLTVNPCTHEKAYNEYITGNHIVSCTECNYEYIEECVDSDSDYICDICGASTCYHYYTYGYADVDGELHRANYCDVCGDVYILDEAIGEVYYLKDGSNQVTVKANSLTALKFVPDSDFICNIHSEGDQYCDFSIFLSENGLSRSFYREQDNNFSATFLAKAGNEYMLVLDTWDEQRDVTKTIVLGSGTDNHNSTIYVDDGENHNIVCEACNEVLSSEPHVFQKRYYEQWGETPYIVQEEFCSYCGLSKNYIDSKELLGNATTLHLDKEYAILANADNVFSFTPEVTGEYTLFATDIDYYGSFVVDANGNSVVNIGNPSEYYGLYRHNYVKLEAGVTYYFVIAARYEKGGTFGITSKNSHNHSGHEAWACDEESHRSVCCLCGEEFAVGEHNFVPKFSEIYSDMFETDILLINSFCSECGYPADDYGIEFRGYEYDYVTYTPGDVATWPENCDTNFAVYSFTPDENGRFWITDLYGADIFIVDVNSCLLSSGATLRANWTYYVVLVKNDDANYPDVSFNMSFVSGSDEGGEEGGEEGGDEPTDCEHSYCLDIIWFDDCESLGYRCSFCGYSKSVDSLDCQALSLNEVTPVYIEDGMTVISYTATEPKNYTIYSSGSSDVYVYVFNSDFSKVAYDDDSGEDYNFSCVFSMEAGDTYYFAIKTYGDRSTHVELTDIDRHTNYVCSDNGDGTHSKNCSVCGLYLGTEEHDVNPTTRYSEDGAKVYFGMICSRCDNEKFSTDDVAGSFNRIRAINLDDTISIDWSSDFYTVLSFVPEKSGTYYLAASELDCYSYVVDGQSNLISKNDDSERGKVLIAELESGVEYYYILANSGYTVTLKNYDDHQTCSYKYVESEDYHTITCDICGEEFGTEKHEYRYHSYGTEDGIVVLNKICKKCDMPEEYTSILDLDSYGMLTLDNPCGLDNGITVLKYESKMSGPVMFTLSKYCEKVCVINSDGTIHGEYDYIESRERHVFDAEANETYYILIETYNDNCKFTLTTKDDHSYLKNIDNGDGTHETVCAMCGIHKGYASHDIEYAVEYNSEAIGSLVTYSKFCRSCEYETETMARTELFPITVNAFTDVSYSFDQEGKIYSFTPEESCIYYITTSGHFSNVIIVDENDSFVAHPDYTDTVAYIEVSLEAGHTYYFVPLYEAGYTFTISSTDKHNVLNYRNDGDIHIGYCVSCNEIMVRDKHEARRAFEYNTAGIYTYYSCRYCDANMGEYDFRDAPMVSLGDKNISEHGYGDYFFIFRIDIAESGYYTLEADGATDCYGHLLDLKGQIQDESYMDNIYISSGSWYVVILYNSDNTLHNITYSLVKK